MTENNKQSQLIIWSRNPNSQFPISVLIFIEKNVPLAIIKHFPRLVCRKLIRKMIATQCRQTDRDRRNDRKRGNDSIDSTSMACIISTACLSLYLHVKAHALSPPLFPRLPLSLFCHFCCASLSVPQHLESPVTVVAGGEMAALMHI